MAAQPDVCKLELTPAGTAASPLFIYKPWHSNICAPRVHACTCVLQDKQAESLKERLVGRLALGGPREWRTVAWCIGQLGYSEKGMRRIIELTPSYRHALAEQQVGGVRVLLICDLCCGCSGCIMGSWAAVRRACGTSLS